MADLPTLEEAMKLADQDCPLPGLAGPALKVLRKHIVDARAALELTPERVWHAVRVMRQMKGTDCNEAAPMQAAMHVFRTPALRALSVNPICCCDLGCSDDVCVVSGYRTENGHLHIDSVINVRFLSTKHRSQVMESIEFSVDPPLQSKLR